MDTTGLGLGLVPGACLLEDGLALGAEPDKRWRGPMHDRVRASPTEAVGRARPPQQSAV